MRTILYKGKTINFRARALALEFFYEKFGSDAQAEANQAIIQCLVMQNRLDGKDALDGLVDLDVGTCDLEGLSWESMKASTVVLRLLWAMAKNEAFVNNQPFGTYEQFLKDHDELRVADIQKAVLLEAQDGFFRPQDV